MTSSNTLSPAQASFAAIVAAHGLTYSGPKQHQPAKFRLNKQFSFTTQLSHMLQLQERMNTDTAPHWRTAGFAWMRAAMVEGVEGLCHYDSWKWWKKGKPDRKQAMFELVDIWHFNLSWYMVRFECFDSQDETLLTAITRRIVEAAHAYSLRPAPENKTEAVNRAFERLVGSAVSGVPDLDAFVELCIHLDMGLDELYKGYLQKNMLNFFRQKYGYKTGRYLKSWKDGLEDNVYLDRVFEGIRKSLDFSSHAAIAELERRLWEDLTKHYVEACEGLSCLDRDGHAPLMGTQVSEFLFKGLDGATVALEGGFTVRLMPVAEK